MLLRDFEQPGSAKLDRLAKRIEAGTVVARFEGAPELAVGSAAAVSVGEVHLFDAQSELAL